jgi:hypothetical protein
LTIGYNENMYTKLDHKKKKYYTIQENKENKITHNNIVDYVQIRDVFLNFWDHLTWEEYKKWNLDWNNQFADIFLKRLL